MTRQARRTSATTKRAGRPRPAEPDAPVAELLDDRTMAIGSDTARPRGRRQGFVRSLPGALVGTFLVAGLAFGAALGPNGLLSAGASKGDAHDGDGSAAYHAGDGSVEKTPTPTESPWSTNR